MRLMLKKSFYALTYLHVVTVGLLLMSMAVNAEQTITIKKSELESIIDARVRVLMNEYKLDSDAVFNDRVAKGIRAYIAQQEENKNSAAHQRAALARPVTEDEHIYGDPGAPFSIIEYSDYECPFCKRFHVSKTLNQFVEKYDGKINWVYRHYPLGFHNPNAQEQAEAAECANELLGNKGFWKYSDEIYKRTKSNKTYPRENLVPLAVELGFDRVTFTECFESRRHRAYVENDFADGKKAGISGTPGNILRHNETGESRVISGAVPLSTLVRELKVLANKVDVDLGE